MKEAKRQTRKVGVAGGFVNQLYGNNSTEPKVGEGATVYMYSDRNAYQVTAVAEDGESCTIQRCNVKRTDNNGMSESQTYDYSELYTGKTELRWRPRKAKWCKVTKEVRFIPRWWRENIEILKDETGYIPSLRNCISEELHKQLTDTEGDGWLTVVKGITKEYTNYHPVSIGFGHQEEYHDFSF